MTVDLSNYLFWVVGAIWFTVPILSWLWSAASIRIYRRANILFGEAAKTLENAKTLNEQMVSYRLETLELRTKVEEEMRMACKYYSRITELITDNKNSNDTVG